MKRSSSSWLFLLPLLAVPGYARNWTVSVSPSSGAGPGARFEIAATLPSGSQGIRSIFGLFGTYPSNWNACSWLYDTRRGTLGLQANTPQIYEGDLAPGTPGVLENSYCQISDLSVSVSTTTYTLSMEVSIKVPWSGAVLNQWVGVDEGLPLEWDIYTQWRVVSAMAVTGSSTAPEEIKGVQAVLMHCWDKTSRSKFKDTLADINAPKIVISSAPYVDRCTMAAGQTERVANLNDVLNSLTGRTEVHVIVFAGGLQGTSPPTGLGARFKHIWEKIIKPRADTAQYYFHVGADLEDHYSNRNVDGYFNQMVKALDAADVAVLDSLVTQGPPCQHN